MEERGLLKVIVFLITVSVALVFTYSYLFPITEATPLDDNKATDEGVRKVSEGNNKFALDLYKKLSTDDENVFFSPWSISTALSMTYEGSRGQTAKEMRTVLHLPKNDTVRRSSFAKLYNLMNMDKKYELSLANALWTQENYTFLDKFIDVNKNYYGAKVDNANFIDPEEREQTRKKINQWVKEKTDGKIKKIIAKGKLNHRTRLVLTNAIYFKGNWVKQFDKDLTQKETFKVAPGESVDVSMMTHKEEQDFNYTETQNLKAIELPYKGKNLAMYIILPKDDFGLSVLEDNLTTERLSKLEKDMRTQEVDVRLPKFEFETTYSLKKALKQMGMKKTFSRSNANFSGMDGTNKLFIQFVTHKAYVKVNEKGTEAAASTAVGMGATSAVMTKFHADHPFLFYIKDKRTDNILFLGRIINPER